MSKARLVTVAVLGGFAITLLDIAYAAGKIEGKGYAKASLSADADPSPVDVDGEEETDTAPESDEGNGE